MQSNKEIRYWDFNSNSHKTKPAWSFKKRDENVEFDFETHRYRYKHSYTKRQGRAYHRLNSGLQVAENQKKIIRFMTLTTSKNGNSRHLNKHFEILKKRIERKYDFKFNQYFKVQTSEGNGVLHIVFCGKYIPQKWLSNQWKEIHNSPIIDIRVIKGESKRIARYLVGNYLCSQPIVRMSYGWKWVHKGFATSWCGIKKVQGFKHYEIVEGKKVEKENVMLEREGVIQTYGYKRGLEVWKNILRNPLKNSRQIKLKKFHCINNE